MKFKIMAAMLSMLSLAFNYDAGSTTMIYFNSLKFLKQADQPINVTMVHSGRTSGQSTLVTEGTLFTYKNRSARSVRIAGSFCDWKPEPMERSDNGVWYYFLPAGEQGKKVTYKYRVDGIWTADPRNPEKIDDRMGSYLSVAEPSAKKEGRRVSWRKSNGSMIEFRIWRPDASFISIVGDFNNWNPEHDILAKGRDGIWRMKKKLLPGVYRYKFMIDGDWVPDTYNDQSASDDTGEVCSVIEIAK